MARERIRAFPLSINGKKIAEVSDGTYEIMSGDEAQIATEGYIGHSDGATTCKVNPNCIIPVKGMQFAIDDLILNKRYCTIGMPVNGKLHQVDVRCISASYKWDHKSGTAHGTFDFAGGQPDLTG